MFLARRFFAIACFLLISQAAIEAATIKLQAVDRFRFFAHQEDFETHLRTFEAAGRNEQSPVLSTEHKFYESGNRSGRGWAEEMVKRTCWNPFTHEFSFRCIRGNADERAKQTKRIDAAENYFNPQFFKIGATLEGAPAGATCKWQMQDGEAKTIYASEIKCAERITFKLPIKPGTTLSKVTATVQITDAGKTEEVRLPEKTFRHLRIAGIGDSIASGEGNPDKPVTFDTSRTLCYLRSVLNYNSRLTPRQEKNQYWRPGRLGFLGDASCAQTHNQQGDQTGRYYTPEEQRASWSTHRAEWLSPGCHRSMYGNQFRSALQVAIERDDVTVTYIPLGCTGATIKAGLLGVQPAREIYCPPGIGCLSWMPAQVDKLDEYRRYFAVPPKTPAYDAILLTIGANDMGFSGLVASVMFDAALEKLLQSWGIGFVSAKKAEEKLGDLPEDFKKLAGRLNRLVGDDLRRVVFTTYPNPATSSPGQHCPAGRAGLDIHPQMNADLEEMKKGWTLTQDKFLPLLKKIAECPLQNSKEGKCENHFTFVYDRHGKFEERGYCTRSAADPDFDKECFREDGDAFFHATRPDGSAEPNFGKLRCKFKAADYPAFVKRQRWIRSPNDSYFAANTFPDGLGRGTALSDPFNLIWAANYGGAFHPTAEGHAAIADEIVLKLRDILK